MQIAIPRERAPGENRVAMVPDVATRLIGVGHSVTIEAGAGRAAHFSDEQYRDRGVEVNSSLDELYSRAGVVCKVQAPTVDEISQFRSDTVLVSLYQPTADPAVAQALAERRVTSFSLDLLPRISRAQSMDALSSQANVSGYRAALLAAQYLPKFFPMLMTAAGTVPPAKVLVLGAGVAGLGAIATARRLGAIVRGHDVRVAAKEEVESLGAIFVPLALESQEGAGGYARAQSEDFLTRQRELITVEVIGADAVISTAAIPGRTAPVLITADMVSKMAAGSVIIDIAAESGGNCELSIPGEVVVHHGVQIVGTKNLPSTMAVHASFLYARNIAEFVAILATKGALSLDFDDEILAATCVTHDGAVRHEPTRAIQEEVQL